MEKTNVKDLEKETSEQYKNKQTILDLREDIVNNYISLLGDDTEEITSFLQNLDIWIKHYSENFERIESDISGKTFNCDECGDIVPVCNLYDDIRFYAQIGKPSLSEYGFFSHNLNMLVQGMSFDTIVSMSFCRGCSKMFSINEIQKKAKKFFKPSEFYVIN